MANSHRNARPDVTTTPFIDERCHDRMNLQAVSLSFVATFRKKGEWSETQAGVTRVTSTEIGPSASTQMISPVMRPTARRSSSTARRCASAPAVP
jgi:hypothetical protein